MTIASLNGWSGIDNPHSALLATGTVPGTRKQVTLRRTVLPVFLAFLADWHKTVMPLDVPGALGPDGWQYRDARTGAGLSNHASGTAVDVRYDVLKADHQRHMTPAQVAAVHALLDRYVTSDGRRIFGWGGDWKVGQFCDEMHTELAQGWAAGTNGQRATQADVDDVIRRMGIRPDGTRPSPIRVVTVGGSSPVNARSVAWQLGTSVARVVWRNPWLARRAARPGDKIRLPDGVDPVLIHAGKHAA